MGISLKTHKMLWGRSGNMCAFPDCKKILVVDETLTDDPSVIGEEAHIVAQKKDGPRGLSELTPEQRDKYDNLILLCSIHHKIVDDQEHKYTVDQLKEFKANHETWIRTNLKIDNKKVKDDELYAGYIEKFIELTDLHNWNIWTSWILGASQVFPKKRFEAMKKVPDYIVSRIWPNRYPELEAAFVNFKSVLNDLMRVYHEYLKERSDGVTVEKFYKSHYDDIDPFEQNKLVDKYNYHNALIEDLILELTRAANYICDKIRDYIFEGFRLDEGALLITRGDILSSNTYRVEYRGDQRTTHPYPGLREFMTLREQRDLYIGTGIEEDYFRNVRGNENCG
jgi:hypothetical protein